jgi:hypothetical protein
MGRFEPSAHQILITGLLEGPQGRVRRVRYLLDTGTPHTVFDAPITDSIGFGPDLMTGTSRLWGVSGVSVGYVVRAARVRVLSREVHGYPVAVHDLPNDLGVEALLGLDFFKACFLGIDFRVGLITVDSSRPPPESRERTVISTNSGWATATCSLEVPTRKISETILDFGEPFLSGLSGTPPPTEDMKNAMMIVITIWNALVMAEAPWNAPSHLEGLKQTASQGGPPFLLDTLNTLTRRRKELFAGDPRAVGNWEFINDASGEPRFRCDARLPPGFKLIE